MFEVGPGFTARLRWERTEGVHFPTSEPLTPEKIAGKWKEITDFSGNTTHPESAAEATSMLMKGAAAQKSKEAAGGAAGNEVLEKAKSMKIPPGEYTYDNQEGMISHDE